MVIDQYLSATNGAADKLLDMAYGEDTMVDAQDPGDDERLKKVAFVRDAARVFVTVLVTVAIAAAIYFVAKKTGVLSWIQSKIR